MLLDRLDGHLLPVEDSRSQGGLHIGFFKNLTEVFDLSGTGEGNYWNGDVIPGVVDQLYVKATNSIFMYWAKSLDI